MTLREEFRLKKFGFSDVATERFCTFQWRTYGLVYLIYRLLVAVYTITWLAITRSQAKKTEDALQDWGAYLTNWTYTLLTVYFMVHALVALVVYSLCRGAPLKLTKMQRPNEHKNMFHELRFTAEGYQEIREEVPPEVIIEESNRLPWYLIIVWVLFSAVSVGAIMVTIVFWAMLVPNLHLDVITNDNFQLHLVNTILILLEQALTAVPIRLLHVLYPILYGVIYMMFSLFYWVADHTHVMYPILDWGKAGPTVGYVFLIGFVFMPVIHSVLYLIYRLKMHILWRLYRE